MTQAMYYVELQTRTDETYPSAFTPEMMALIDTIDPVGDELDSCVEIRADRRIEPMLEASRGVLSWREIQ